MKRRILESIRVVRYQNVDNNKSVDTCKLHLKQFQFADLFRLHTKSQLQ